jgi:hypothetical protein
MPVEGGAETDTGLAVEMWSEYQVTEDGIYFVSAPSEGASAAIQYFEFATGKTTRIASILKPTFHSLSVFPKRGKARWILYTMQDSMNSDLMLVEDFR